MENSCENCVFSSDKSCVLKEIEECQNFEKYKPNYPTLEQENTDLKQQLIVLSAEWNRQHEKRRKAQLENAELKQKLSETTETYEKLYCELRVKCAKSDDSLERACEWIDDYADDKLDCDYCPLCGNKCLNLELSKDNGCKTALIQHFKEATQ